MLQLLAFQSSPIDLEALANEALNRHGLAVARGQPSEDLLQEYQRLAKMVYPQESQGPTGIPGTSDLFHRIFQAGGALLGAWIDRILPPRP